jgi:hypothetical protein
MFLSTGKRKSLLDMYLICTLKSLP